MPRRRNKKGQFVSSRRVLKAKGGFKFQPWKIGSTIKREGKKAAIKTAESMIRKGLQKAGAPPGTLEYLKKSKALVDQYKKDKAKRAYDKRVATVAARIAKYTKPQ